MTQDDSKKTIARHPHTMRPGDVLRYRDLTIEFQRTEGKLVAYPVTAADERLVWERVRVREDE